MFRMRLFLWLAVALPAISFVSCEMDRVAVGPLQEQPVSIELDGAERANVELNLAAGQLNLSGGGEKLLSGTFEYNVPDYKPVIESSRNGSHAVVTVKEPSHHSGYGHTRNDWTLRLNDKTLLDLAINCGAGKAKLDLGQVALRSLEVHMGAGQVDLDLRGTPARDYDVNISGGVGQATVHLPQGVGIRADAQGGIGEINVTGLQKTDGHYENSEYNNAKVNVRITVHGGIGQIRLIG